MSLDNSIEQKDQLKTITFDSYEKSVTTIRLDSYVNFPNQMYQTLIIDPARSLEGSFELILYMNFELI